MWKLKIKWREFIIIIACRAETELQAATVAVCNFENCKIISAKPIRRAI